ncbi:MAG: alpha-L-rhamnosidase, partial [Gorillibacterium sp.]|nr:alpha-L-rhamnosidase [Gorillibacterium sp.]
MKETRVIINNYPFEGFEQKQAEGKAPWESFHGWPNCWISLEEAPEGPFVAAYKRVFDTHFDETVRVHVSADERYELYLDGQFVGRGSDRGDINNWYFETYDLPLTAGKHTLVARVWSLRHLRPWAQFTVDHGFILAPEGTAWTEVIGTGASLWEGMRLEGYSFFDTSGAGIGTGGKVIIEGQAFPWGFEHGEGAGWKQVKSGKSGNNGYEQFTGKQLRIMKPSILPSQMQQEIETGLVRYAAYGDVLKPVLVSNRTDQDQVPVRMEQHEEHLAAQWQGLLNGGNLTVPPYTNVRILVDLQQYYCLYPVIHTSGGKNAEIRIGWDESLFERQADGVFIKKQRDQIENYYFRGIGDRFLLDGGNDRKWDTLWWHAGRYGEIVVTTQEQALVIERLTLTETRYPLEIQGRFSSNNEAINSWIPLAIRGLEMCSHETYMDCPYWEQLMYVGDTRLEAMLTYVLSSDSRLPQKAIRMFDASRLNYTELVTCAYPDTSNKIIPSFVLWWVGMVYDYALWRGDPKFISSVMPGVRSVVDKLLQYRNEEGLLLQPKGWPFMDWHPDWSYGNPPEGGENISASYHWLMVYTLGKLAELEGFVGKQGYAEEAELLAKELAEAGERAFWNEEKGWYADDRTHKYYS